MNECSTIFISCSIHCKLQHTGHAFLLLVSYTQTSFNAQKGKGNLVNIVQHFWGRGGGGGGGIVNHGNFGSTI